MKLDVNKTEYDQKWGWVGSERCDRAGEAEKFLIEHRYTLNIIGGIEDPNADYNYDEYALVKLKGKYYLLNTSGCSCPSPSETWCVCFGPTKNLKSIYDFIKSGDYQGYTLPKWAEEHLLSLIDTELKKKAE